MSRFSWRGVSRASPSSSERIASGRASGRWRTSARTWCCSTMDSSSGGCEGRGDRVPRCARPVGTRRALSSRHAPRAAVRADPGGSPHRDPGRRPAEPRRSLRRDPPSRGAGALPGCGLRGRGPRGPGIGRASSRLGSRGAEGSSPSPGSLRRSGSRRLSPPMGQMSGMSWHFQITTRTGRAISTPSGPAGPGHGCELAGDDGEGRGAPEAAGDDRGRAPPGPGG